MREDGKHVRPTMTPDTGPVEPGSREVASPSCFPVASTAPAPSSSYATSSRRTTGRTTPPQRVDREQSQPVPDLAPCQPYLDPRPCSCTHQCVRSELEISLAMREK